MSYGEVLEKAWRIIWKFKILWIFGILASCGSGSGNAGSNLSNRFSNRTPSNFGNGSNPFGSLPPIAQQWLARMQEALNNGTFWAVFGGVILTLLCVFFILWVIALVVGTFGRIGLVRGAWLADAGEENLTFGSLWSQSSLFFWRVLLLNLLLMVVGLIIGALVVALAIFTFGIGVCLCLPFLIVIGWLINVWTQQTIVGIVGENMGVTEAIGAAWTLITKNIGPYVVMALILFIGGAIIGLIISLPMLLIVVPIMIGGFSQSNTGVTAGLLISGVIFLIYLPFLIVLGGILQSYLGTAWTLVYRRLTGRGPAAGVPAPVPVSPSDLPGTAEAYDNSMKI
jgi:hypothetical protein